MTFKEFRAKMAAIVGDSNTVARYLTEKIGHTALIAWATGCTVLWIVLPVAVHTVVGVVLLAAALGAALVYDGVGKALWMRSNAYNVAYELRDFVFDFWDGAFIAIFPMVFFAFWGPAAALAVWALVFWALDAASWGSPS